VLLAVVALATALVTAGLSAPGRLVGWLLPLAEVLVRLGVATTIGCLVLAVAGGTVARDAFGRLVAVAAGAAALFALAAAAATVLTAVSLLDLTPGLDPAFGAEVAGFVTGTSTGQLWLVTTVLAALIAVLLVSVRTVRAVRVLAVLAALAVVPLAALAAGASPRPAAGLALLMLTVSTVGAGIVVGAAVVSASRAPVPLVIALVALAALLGFGAAVGIGAQPVAPPADATPAEVLTGMPLPPAPTIGSLLLGVALDPLWLTVAAAGIAWLVVRRRAAVAGARRSPARLGAGAVAVVLFLWATCGGLAVYADVLLSARLAQLLIVALAVPVLVAWATPPRAARTAGAETSAPLAPLAALAPPRALRSPVVAALLLIAVLWLATATDVLRWTLSHRIGTDLAIGVAAAAGLLFVRAVVVPRTATAARALAIVLVAAAVIALAAVLVSTASLWVADWFGALAPAWGAEPLDDQRRAGVVVAGCGLVPLLALAVMVARTPRPADAASRRLARRERDAELDAYDAALAAARRHPDRDA
jgi:cytochrome c oxidase assembly factor CtaG